MSPVKSSINLRYFFKITYKILKFFKLVTLILDSFVFSIKYFIQIFYYTSFSCLSCVLFLMFLICVSGVESVPRHRQREHWSRGFLLSRNTSSSLVTFPLRTL